MSDTNLKVMEEAYRQLCVARSLVVMASRTFLAAGTDETRCELEAYLVAEGHAERLFSESVAIYCAERLAP